MNNGQGNEVIYSKVLIGQLIINPSNSDKKEHFTGGNNMKKFVVGFVTGAMIFSTAGAYAASNSKMIEVFYNVANIKINKTSSMPTDPDAKPFVYNGTTFVPLRYISESLNLPVQWDGSTSTVSIGAMEQENEIYIGNGINVMNYHSPSASYATYYNGKRIEQDIHSDYKLNWQALDNAGNKYDNFVVVSCAHLDPGLIEFPLNAQYKGFKTKLGVQNSYKTMNATTIIEVFVDDKSVQKYTLTAGDLPKDIEIDVKNANKITFKYHNENDSLAGFGFFNPYFTK